MMMKLRGHHLICLNFFSGEGYDEGFIRNLEDVLRRAKVDGIEVSCGADDVCVKCPYLKDDKCQYDGNADQEIRRMDDVALGLLKIKKDKKIEWRDITENIQEIFPRWFDKYCIECSWQSACGKNGFYQELRRGMA